MSDSVDRRTVLKGVAASAAAIGPVAEALAAEPDRPPVRAAGPLLLRSLQEPRRATARISPMQPPPRPSPEVLQKINYEEWGKIKYPRRLRPVRRRAGPVPDHLLPSGPVLPEGGRHARGRGRPVAQDHLRAGLFRHAGQFAGARPAGGRGLRRACASRKSRGGALDWRKNDWVAFLGAAYFRSIGELRQYGLSARGVALDVAVADRPEEFPTSPSSISTRRPTARR